MKGMGDYNMKKTGKMSPPEGCKTLRKFSLFYFPAKKA